MGIFFIEAVKKSPGIKILSLLITNYQKIVISGVEIRNNEHTFNYQSKFADKMLFQ